MYEGTSDYGELVICDGVNEPFLFQMTGTGGLTSRTFFAKEITVSGTTGPAFGVIHDKHLVVAGAATAPNTIYYSGTNDIDDFTSTGSGSIVLDDKVFMAPQINSQISGGQTQISGLEDANEAQDIANVLSAGELAAPVKIVEERSVSPSLGKDSINSGKNALLLAFISVLIFILFYYINFS